MKICHNIFLNFQSIIPEPLGFQARFRLFKCNRIMNGFGSLQPAYKKVHAPGEWVCNAPRTFRPKRSVFLDPKPLANAVIRLFWNNGHVLQNRFNFGSGVPVGRFFMSGADHGHPFAPSSLNMQKLMHNPVKHRRCIKINFGMLMRHIRRCLGILGVHMVSLNVRAVQKLNTLSSVIFNLFKQFEAPSI